MGLPLPGQERNDGPLYRLPWSVVFNMAVAASVFGAAQGFVETWIDEAMAELPAEAARFRAGEKKLTGVLVGAVMKKSKGRADPKKVNALLAKRSS